VRTLRRELLAAAVAGWTDAELDTFAGLLSRFNGALGAYRPPPTRTAPARTLTTIAAGAPAGTEQEPA